MKKAISLLLVLGLTAFLAACGGGGGGESAPAGGESPTASPSS